MIHKQIVAAMADIEAITKNRSNQQQNYKFRGIDDAYNALHDVFAKHKIFTVPKILAEKVEERVNSSGRALFYRVLTIEYTVFAEDGSSVSGIVIGEGMDTGDKAANKAMSVAHKYFLLQLFMIPTEDKKDPEEDNHDIVCSNTLCESDDKNNELYENPRAILFSKTQIKKEISEAFSKAKSKEELTKIFNENCKDLDKPMRESFISLAKKICEERKW